MGTIAQKLEYLNDTRLLLKDNINKINNVLDDNSTFRSYPQELFNGYLDILNNGTDTLWNNLEKVSQTGTEAVLEGVETAPIKMVLNGNTSQNTTSGKNKFSTDYLDSYTYDTYTQLSKNSFEFNATTSWKTSRFKIPCKSNTDYYFNLKQDLSVSTRNVYIVIRGVQTGEIIYELYVGYLKAFNSGENTELMINIQSGGAALSGKIYNIQLEEGTSPTEFEEYTGGQPSPSPDYPQEVKVVTGENVVSVQGENLVDIEGIKLNADNIGDYEQGNNYIKATTKAVAWANIGFHIFLEAGTYYYKHYAFLDSEEINTKGIGSLRISPSGVGTAIISQNVANDYLNKINNIVFTITESGIYTFIYRCANNGANVRILNINDIILSKTSTDYVPYSKTDYSINLNANMFDPTQIPEGNFEKRLSTTGGLYGDIDYFVSDWIPIQPNTEYEVNWTPEAKKRICFYSSFLESSFISSNDTENIFKTPNNATYMRFSNLASEISNLSVKLKNSLELCKINTYKDYFHKDSGKWYVHKEIGKVVFDENTTFESYQSFGNYYRGQKKIQDAKIFENNNIEIFSNYFKGNNNVFTYTKAEVGNMGQYKNTIDFYFISTQPTQADFKTWLSTHNTIVYYILATPTETEITNSTLIEQLEAISKAKSVKDKTYITQTNDNLPFILDVEAIKEYEVN